MSDDLIELVRQYKVLYDNKCKEYKDQGMRNAAWEEIANTLNKSVESCKDDWTKLRNSFASVLKRRRKKRGQEGTAVIPWKYEQQMSFLCPFMESRNTKTNIVSPPEAAESPPCITLDSQPLSPYFRSESQCSARSNSSSRQNIGKVGMQDLYELMKSSNDIRMQKQNSRRERDMDENDLFFLSMSKAVKRLSIIEQCKIKLDLHNAVAQAQIRHLEKEHKNRVLQSPINIIPYQVITPQQVTSPSNVSPPNQNAFRSSTQSSIAYHPPACTSNVTPFQPLSPSQATLKEEFDDENLATDYSSKYYSDND